MLLRYRLNRVYGIAGIVFGIFLATLGSFTIFMSWSGAVLIIVGAFLIFSVSSSIVDVAKYRISFSFELFGFIRVGDWIYVRPDMELLMMETRKPFRIRCASNKVIDVSDSKYVIFLYDGKAKKWFLILKCRSKEKGEDELARLSDLLGIQIKEDARTSQKRFLKI